MTSALPSLVLCLCAARAGGAPVADADAEEGASPIARLSKLERLVMKHKGRGYVRLLPWTTFVFVGVLCT